MYISIAKISVPLYPPSCISIPCKIVIHYQISGSSIKEDVLAVASLTVGVLNVFFFAD